VSDAAGSVVDKLDSAVWRMVFLWQLHAAAQYGTAAPAQHGVSSSKHWIIHCVAAVAGFNSY
jgi:hypothetical protein